MFAFAALLPSHLARRMIGSGQLQTVDQVGIRDNKMSDEHSFSVEGCPLTALAARRDRSWGHAIDVSVATTNRPPNYLNF